MSQSNEHDDHLTSTPHEFTQRLKSFSPRAARISIDEILAEGTPVSNAQPVLFPAQSVAGQSSRERTSNSWLRVGIAWSCGMAMGAAITAMLMIQFQNSSGMIDNSLVADSNLVPEENPESSNLDAEDFEVANTYKKHRDRWATRYSIEFPDYDFQRNRPLAVSDRFLMHEQPSHIFRNRYLSGHTESEPNHPDDDPAHSTHEIDFEPGKSKSQRHTLMQELLGETI